MFPDDIIERRSVEAHWVAVFPVGGAPLAVPLKLPLLQFKRLLKTYLFDGWDRGAL